ncbi:hypothetical protein FHG55_12400 [Pseudomonas jessenii]|uniref:Uncharacterized protein n=1 Tax=Pseudomonas jessenii TaxID=77298 RepID=A0A5C4KZW6_PSEJE|nr:hypothetical protein FHG55_12400 [Pseudomonas jessenii]
MATNRGHTCRIICRWRWKCTCNPAAAAIPGSPKTPVGAGLNAMTADQATEMLNVPTSSRASSLPQG